MNDVESVESRIEAEARRDIERIFEEKKRKLGIEASMKLTFLRDFPIIGEYVYGEAFPTEKKILLEVYAPYATGRMMAKTICEELMHIKHPELKHGVRFWRLVEAAIVSQKSGDQARARVRIEWMEEEPPLIGE